jgi:hypothetical protein
MKVGKVYLQLQSGVRKNQFTQRVAEQTTYISREPSVLKTLLYHKSLHVLKINHTKSISNVKIKDKFVPVLN